MALKQEGFQSELVIDGTHIAITAPHKDSADFYNRKGWHSVTEQNVSKEVKRNLITHSDTMEGSCCDYHEKPRWWEETDVIVKLHMKK